MPTKITLWADTYIENDIIYVKGTASCESSPIRSIQVLYRGRDKNNQSVVESYFHTPIVQNYFEFDGVNTNCSSLYDGTFTLTAYTQNGLSESFEGEWTGNTPDSSPEAIAPPSSSSNYNLNFNLKGAKETNNTWNVNKNSALTAVSTATKAGEIYARLTVKDSNNKYAYKTIPIVIDGIKFNKYYGYYFFGKEMYDKLNQKNIRKVTVRLYNLDNQYIYQSSYQDKTFVLYAHNYESYDSCSNVSNLEDKLIKIKQIKAPLEKASYIDFVLTNEELTSLKKYKGVAFGIVDKDNLTVHGIKCSIFLNKGLNIVEPEEPKEPELPAENLILYEKGKHYSDTPFGTVNMLSSWNRKSDIYFETNPYESLLWFSWNNNANISKYEYLEINITNTVYHNTDLIVTRNSELDSLEKTTKKGYGYISSGENITKHNMIVEKTTEKISKGSNVTHKIPLSKITQNGTNGYLHLYFYRKDYNYTAFTEIIQINSIKLIAKENEEKEEMNNNNNNNNSNNNNSNNNNSNNNNNNSNNNNSNRPVITDLWAGTDGTGYITYKGGKYYVSGSTRVDIFCYVNTICGLDHVQYVNISSNTKVTCGPQLANNPPVVYVGKTMYFAKGTTNTVQVTAIDKSGRTSVTKTIIIVIQ